MTDYLTQDNGVVCRHCFKTINLTKIKSETSSKLKNFLDGFRSDNDSFKIRCPFCNRRAFYDYHKDVKPILNTDQIQKKEYQEKLENVKEGARMIVKEVLLQSPIPSESDSDLEQIEPRKPSKSNTDEKFEHFK